MHAAYLAVKSYSFSYDKKDTGQYIYWFTDNSTKRETNAKRQFYRGLLHGINHYSKMDANLIVNGKIGRSLVVCLRNDNDIVVDKSTDNAKPHSFWLNIYNSTVREECKRQFYWGLMHGINHYS